MSCLKDLLIKVYRFLTSFIKFYVINMLVNNLERFFEGFFFCIVRVRIYMETNVLSFLTSVYFSKVALTN